MLWIRQCLMTSVISGRSMNSKLLSCEEVAKLFSVKRTLFFPLSLLRDWSQLWTWGESLWCSQSWGSWDISLQRELRILILLLPWAFRLGLFWLCPGWSSCGYFCLVLWVLLEDVTANIYDCSKFIYDGLKTLQKCVIESQNGLCWKAP